MHYIYRHVSNAIMHTVLRRREYIIVEEDRLQQGPNQLMLPGQALVSCANCFRIFPCLDDPTANLLAQKVAKHQALKQSDRMT